MMLCYNEGILADGSDHLIIKKKNSFHQKDLNNANHHSYSADHLIIYNMACHVINQHNKFNTHTHAFAMAKRMH